MPLHPNMQESVPAKTLYFCPSLRFKPQTSELQIQFKIKVGIQFKVKVEK